MTYPGTNVILQRVTPRRQHIGSSLLIVSLVLGSVLAPFSHYLWMAAVGHFEHGKHEVTAPGHHHDAPVLASDAADVDGCRYSDLFATHLAGPLGFSSINRPDLAPTAVAPADRQTPASDRQLDRLTRGPPAA